MKNRVVMLAVFAVVCAGALLAQAPVLVDATVGTHSAVSGVPRRGPILDEFGTSYMSFYVVSSFEMSPLASANQYSAINNGYLRYLTNAAGTGLGATIHLPSGALVQYIELDYYDSSASGEAQASLGICDFEGTACTFQATDDTPGCGLSVCSGIPNTQGYGFLPAYFNTPFTINNAGTGYRLYTGNTTNDGSTAISQVIIGYTLQVSAAPGTPTFTDVAPDNIYYQFIEALAASGITGGCNQVPLQYCPDRPITRAEMAVFLAKALGLYFE